MTLQKLILAAAAIAGGSTAFAFDGTINITGKVTDQTCAVKTGTETLSVQLPEVGATSLNSANKTAGTTAFVITLQGCKPGSGKVTTYFEPGDSIAGSRLKNTSTNSPALNVEVQLLNNNYAPIDLSGSTASAQSATAVPLNSTDINLQYYAQYYATDVASPGEVKSTVNYTIVYN